jgi:hypothetical protein
VIDWNVFAPRVGVSADLAGDGRAILKFSYSQYWLNPGVATGFNVNPNSNVWWRRHPWRDSNFSGVWEAGEEGEAQATRGGEATETLDPSLQLPFIREAAVWVERELRGNAGARVGLVWRGERQQFLRQNANQPFEAFVEPVLIADPGPDGILNTQDDGVGIEGRQLGAEFVNLPPVNVVRNVPNANGDYWTLDLTAIKRFNRRWSVVAGFAHTWNQDQANAYFGQPVRQSFYPLTPNDLINAVDNGQYRFTTWVVKVYGTYQAPWDLRLSPLLRHQSGQPFGRTFSTSLNYGNNIRILAEPLGTRRMDNVTLVDLRVEKAFDVQARRIGVFVDLFNLLNGNPEQNTSWSSGSFLRPLNVVAPRIVRLGAKLEW